MKSPVIYYIYLGLIAAFWGGSFLAIHCAIQEYPPYFSAFLRIFFCLIFLGIYFLVWSKKNLITKYWISAVVSGLFIMGFPWACLFWGEQYVAPALAGILNSTVPIFVVVFSPLITPLDKISWTKKLGIFVGFIGVAIIFGPDIHGGLNIYFLGLFAVLMMAVFYAIGVLWTRRLTVHIENSVILLYQSIGAAVFLFLLSMTFEPMPTHFSLKPLLAILYLGICSTALAWLMFYQIVKHKGSVLASTATLCVPLVAILLDVIFLNKFITLYQALGASLILIGMVSINRREKVS